jgi:tryptophan synthase
MISHFLTSSPGYYNPLLAYGEDKAIQDAAEAGANGFIMVDLPPEEAIAFREKCAKAQSVVSQPFSTCTLTFCRLSYVPLIAPSTTLNRLAFLAPIADTFIYVVSRVFAPSSTLSRKLKYPFHADGDDRFF